jgi:hypothetical protein
MKVVVTRWRKELASLPARKKHWQATANALGSNSGQRWHNKDEARSRMLQVAVKCLHNGTDADEFRTRNEGRNLRVRGLHGCQSMLHPMQ